MKAAQNVKNWPPNHQKKEMCIFGLHSTADDQPSNLSNKSCLKCKKLAAKSSRNEMFIFGLCLTSDDWPSDLSVERHPKCEKWPPDHQKMKCSFLDYIQLLMISQAI